MTESTHNPEDVAASVATAYAPQEAFAPGTLVRGAFVYGARQIAMRVWIDPIALAGRGLTATEVSAAKVSPP